MSTTINLEGRTARCSCGKTRPSSTDLAFFVYRGVGSYDASRCTCGFSRLAHLPTRDSGCCTGYTPRGPHDTDSYYCGHGGWD